MTDPKKENEVVSQEKKKKSSVIQHLFSSRRFMYLLALLSALILWMVVVILQPDYTDTISGIPVQLNKEDSVLTQLSLIPIGWKDTTVRVKASGDRLDFSSLSGSRDFSAQVDLSSVTGPGTYELDVVMTKSPSTVTVDERSVTPNRIQVVFDQKEQKNFTPTVDISNISVGENYMKGTPVISPDTVVVSGGETDLATVSSVSVELEESLTNLDDSYSGSAHFVLRDSAGKEIQNPNIQVSREKATVNIPVYRVETLPLKVKFYKYPPSFPLEELQYALSPAQITVYGPKKVIANMKEVELEPLSLAELTPGYQKNLALELPASCRAVGDVDEVQFSLTNPNLNMIRLNTENIQVYNSPIGYDVQWESGITFKDVKIVGDAEVLKSLSGSDVIARVDMGDRTVEQGKAPYPVQFIVQNKGAVWSVTDDVSIVLTVTQRQTSK